MHSLRPLSADSSERKGYDDEQCDKSNLHSGSCSLESPSRHSLGSFLVGWTPRNIHESRLQIQLYKRPKVFDQTISINTNNDNPILRSNDDIPLLHKSDGDKYKEQRIACLRTELSSKSAVTNGEYAYCF